MDGATKDVVKRALENLNSNSASLDELLKLVNSLKIAQSKRESKEVG